jgi:hypothetical protein
MTTERRAATRRFAFKVQNHGGPLGRVVTQRQAELATSVRSERQSLPRGRGRDARAADFPTDFPPIVGATEGSRPTGGVGPTPVAVSKACPTASGLSRRWSRIWADPPACPVRHLPSGGPARRIVWIGATRGRELRPRCASRRIDKRVGPLFPCKSAQALCRTRTDDPFLTIEVLTR